MGDGNGRADRLAPRNAALSDEAIDWIVRLGSGSATDAERAEFDLWRARSPAHAAAADEAVMVLHGVGHTKTADEYREIGKALRPPPQSVSHRFNRRKMLSGGVAALVVGGVTASGVFGPASRLIADHGTGVGERKKVELGDGSIAWLNTSSALSVDFSAAERRLTLLAGEALFEVAKDRKRPFIVASGNGEARALGTVYSVRRQGNVSDVVVTEGVVEVRSGSAVSRLVAGQRVSFGEQILGAIRSVDSEALTAWVRGKLIFNARPLREVVAELERYHHGRILITNDRLRDIKVTGVFDLADPAALFRAISEKTRARIVQMPLLTIIR